MVNCKFISSGSETTDYEDSRQFVMKGNIQTTRSMMDSTRSTRVGGKSTRAVSRGRPSRSRRVSIENPHAKHFVEHDYHDHLHDSILSPGKEETEHLPMVNESQDGEANDDGTKRHRAGHRGGVAVPFPEKLHYMLSQMEGNGTDNIVSWQPHGRCFIVRKPKEFVEEIMPKFFRQTKMTSFQRQLNLYGFSRLTAGTDRGGYYHELFIRGRMDLCKRMVRTRVKGNGSKAAASPSTEPNFYEMEFCLEKQEDPVLEDNTIPLNIEIMPDSEKSICQGPCLVEDHDDSTSMDDTAMDRNVDVMAASTPMGSSSIVSVGNRTDSWTSLPGKASPLSRPAPSKLSPPVLVSPIQEERALTKRSQDRPLEALVVPSFGTFRSSTPFIHSHWFEDPRNLRSGDEVFFEGLPFHYLETKDIEGSLFVAEV